MKKLCELRLFQEGVIQLVKHDDSKMQRRLLDLGFCEGTVVKKVLISPQGDPIAYKVRGATIALRNADAAFVWVEGEKGNG